MSERPPATGRRTWSRITSPFAATKSRHIAEFSVKPDDEHKLYAPGDTVKGHIRLRLTKPIRVTHIVVCLHGFAQVYKAAGTPVEAPKSPVGAAAGRKKLGDGFASLFEDESVLCGDGRLDEGIYQFEFELVFPDRSLPSSIDFERGAISYMITATVTRPNTMAPVVTTDRKISFVETIDISTLDPPRARTITLEPLSKRARGRNLPRRSPDLSEKGSHSAGSPSRSSVLRTADISDAASALADRGGSNSPVLSEISLDSRLSTSTRMVQTDAMSRRSSTPSDSGKAYSSKTSLSHKVISVTIESQAGGCLQGDYIPIRVDISHTKHVRSLYGVIVTLFRQARVESRPLAPVGPTEKGKASKADEYYTKSLTGLSGLSLSGTASSHMFRKDLCQVVRPLYIDPQALTTEIKARVRVPDEAFPTISSVPGSIISFKYYVEVVVDIQGKLQSLDKGIPSFTAPGAPVNPSPGDDMTAERVAATSIIDTAPVRRDKGVVSATFEVVIGTKDSERRKGKRRMVDAVVETPQAAPPQTESPAPYPQAHTEESDYGWYPANGHHQDYDYREYDGSYGYNGQWDGYYSHQMYSEGGDYYHPPPPPPPPPPALPLPQLQNESEMSEKQRIQQAELRLLPSQPPGLDAAPLEDAVAVGGAPPRSAPYMPSAPPLGPSSSAAGPAGEAFSSASAPAHSAPAYASQPDVRPAATEAAAPEYTTTAGPSTAGPSIATAPPHDIPAAGQEEAATALEPSAPTLDEVDVGARAGSSSSYHDSHADAAASSELPRYER
ncbi:hypothetical protein BDY17DRAFT_300618 [Neohortaea acidophila]|uniref:Arrestin C-terminal-like domain-containing protein n=1 Tax=Neohortaea acidophila TaxID=245834 RepID=A0A6A6PMB6_9PEZI|nr:uncharacterized protein BDY17DRAFT_300618 [Neohortaea acidophila]KAF2481055.1 hypothetical protein BDY17DRAFT_300618 [Neohortaea acidophila]